MYQLFVKRLFITALLIVLLVISLNYFMDPFGVHSLPVIKGINHHKPEIQSRVTAAFNLIKYKPKNIFLGTSRTLLGFRHETLKSIENGDGFYNAGFTGAGFDEIYSYFLHALHVQPDLKRVIVGIDLFSFNENRKLPKDFNEERLQKSSYNLKDLKDVLFTYHAVSLSFRTFAASAFEYGTQNAIAQMGERTYLTSMLKSDDNYANYKLDPNKIQKFNELVAKCKENSIELKVFICPVKAVYWNFYFENGLWKHVEGLKRQLCSVYPIWDFSGFNLITTESLESEGNALYHECSHFTYYTGGLLMQRMNNQPSTIDSVGFLLTPETIDEALMQIKKDRREWVIKYHRDLK